MSATSETSPRAVVIGRAAPPTLAGKEARSTARPIVRSRRRRRVWIGVAVLAVAVVLVAMTRPIGRLRGWLAGEAEDPTLYTVRPVTLNVTLKEDGEVKPVKSIELKNEVQGQRVTIEWIIPESTRVSKDDLLIKLASDDIKDRVETEEIELRATRSALEDAQQALAITKSENDSKIKRAEIDLALARLELQRYLEGDYEKSLATAKIAIKQTQMDLERKREELEKSRPLLEKGFVTKSKIEELEDEIEKLEMTLTRNELELQILNDYELKKNQMQKSSAVEQAEEELERERQRSASRQKQAEAKVENQQGTLKNREQRFERMKEQLAKCETRAPADGVVQYGESGERRYWGGNRIATGEQVYPGQTIITLPDTSQMMVTTRIHEADRHKIAEGLTCIVKVPAVPGQTFTGKLTKIAKFADSERSWWNPNLKEHAAEILLNQTDAQLSPGDTAHIEIMIEEVPDVLAVPVQCVFSRGSQHFVFLHNRLSAGPAEVKLGRITTNMVEITEGVSAGDQVLMAPDERLLAMLPAPSTTTPEPPPPEPAAPATH
jgi:RND family efflux transporter MFP subunit